MPANTPYELQTDVLRTALTNLGKNGITIDPTVYPDTSDALIVWKDLTEVFQAAQAAQNAATGEGEGVEFITKTNGALAAFEDPPGSGTFLNARPVVISAEYNEVVAVTDIVPNPS